MLEKIKAARVLFLIIGFAIASARHRGKSHPRKTASIATILEQIEILSPSSAAHASEEVIQEIIRLMKISEFSDLAQNDPVFLDGLKRIKAVRDRCSARAVG